MIFLSRPTTFYDPFPKPFYENDTNRKMLHEFFPQKSGISLLPQPPLHLSDHNEFSNRQEIESETTYSSFKVTGRDQFSRFTKIHPISNSKFDDDFQKVAGL